MNFNAMSDDELFSIYSDFYKDVNGFRPRGHSREQAISWLEFELSPEQQARRRELEAAEEAHWQELERKWAAEEEASRSAAEEQRLFDEEQGFYDIEQRLV